MDKTLKLRTYPDSTQNDVAKERNIALELEKKTAHLEEERNKSLDLVKTIVQLRESLKQEQEKTAVLEARVIKLDSVEENQLIRKNAQLEEEKKKSLEYMKTIEQLRESLTQEQERTAQLSARIADLETKVIKLDSVEESHLVRKNTELEEEKKKSLEYMKTIEQLRDSSKQDLEKSAQMLNKLAELQAKVNKMDAVEESQLVKKNTQLEEEKKKSLEYAKLVDQLREKLRQDQGISDDLVDYVVELEIKVKGLSEVAGKISSLVVEKKLDSNN